MLLCGIALWSCRKPVTYSEIPEIKFKNFTIKNINTELGVQRIGLLEFSFVDGDGDLGLNQADTFPPYDKQSKYHYNLYIQILRKTGNTFTEVVFPNPYYYRFGNLPDVRDRQNKVLKGDLFIELAELPEDTLKCKFYIYDRAHNKSNVDSTSVFVVKK